MPVGPDELSIGKDAAVVFGKEYGLGGGRPKREDDSGIPFTAAVALGGKYPPAAPPVADAEEPGGRQNGEEAPGDPWCVGWEVEGMLKKAVAVAGTLMAGGPPPAAIDQSRAAGGRARGKLIA